MKIVSTEGKHVIYIYVKCIYIQQKDTHGRKSDYFLSKELAMTVFFGPFPRGKNWTISYKNR